MTESCLVELLVRRLLFPCLFLPACASQLSDDADDENAADPGLSPEVTAELLEALDMPTFPPLSLHGVSRPSGVVYIVCVSASI